ncbi:MAG: isocitrate/isopropylmalate dehydrogenase family protein [Candidatus Odinarchaeia archaeon]
MKTVTLIPGDGIGPEICDAMVRVVDASGAKIKWDIVVAGAAALEKYNTPLPDEVIESFKRNKVALKGPITTPFGTGFRSVTVALRQMFDLYANVRPAKIIQGVRTRYENIDLVCIRENTEGAYCGIEFEKGSNELIELIGLLKKTHKIDLSSDAGVSLKVISKHRSERITRFAFEYAIKHGRKKVTAVHKANILKFSDGLFLNIAREMAKKYPQIEYEERVVDNMCMQLVQKPELYDVLVLPNLYGDIISDLCAGLVGGLGIVPGANIGDEYAMFEAVHGSAPKYAGQNKVNPTAIIRAAVMMLQHINEWDAANKIERAVEEVIKEGKKVTYDLKPPGDPSAVGTQEMANAIIEKMETL